MAKSLVISKYSKSEEPKKITTDCYVCLQMQLRKPQLKQDGPSTTCLLCNNPFCETHKGGDEGVCEIDHVTYCGKPKHRARHAPVEIYTTLAARRERLGDV